MLEISNGDLTCYVFSFEDAVAHFNHGKVKQHKHGLEGRAAAVHPLKWICIWCCVNFLTLSDPFIPLASFTINIVPKDGSFTPAVFNLKNIPVVPVVMITPPLRESSMFFLEIKLVIYYIFF